MVNWKKIHLDFTPELQKKWEKEGFGCEETKQWIEAGLKVNDADFAYWLKNIKQVDAKWVKNNGYAFRKGRKSYNWLREEYQEYKEKFKTYTFKKLEAEVKQGKIDRRVNIRMKSKYNRVVTMGAGWLDHRWNKIELLDRWWGVGGSLENKILAKGKEYSSIQYLLKENGTFANKEILEQFKKFSNEEREIKAYNSTTEQTSQVKIKDLTFSPNHYFDDKEIIEALAEDGKIFGGGDHGRAFQSKESFQFMQLLTGSWINSINLLRDKEFSFQEIVDLRSTFAAANYRNNYLVEVEVGSEASEEKSKQSTETNVNKENEQQEILGAEVISQIKDFSNYWDLNFEQRSLVDKLMFSKELKRRYRAYDLCQECYQPNTGENWCQSCNSKHFEKDFDKWTSGNQKIDELIRQHQTKEATGNHKVLEWMPYEKFTKIEYIADGGFGKIYKSQPPEGPITKWNIKENKWERMREKSVALKILHNSQDRDDFLQEVFNHKSFGEGPIVQCYGISQNLQTNDYVMILDYIPSGSLREYLKDNYEKLSFREKFAPLQDIALGLKYIHKKGLVHCDLHPGNILSSLEEASYTHSFVITDLGLSRPASSEKKEKNTYGVLPYVAPETLRHKGYSQATDVYSWSMIAYEIITGKPPYYDFPHEKFLALSICKGLRPNLNEVVVPQLLKDLITRCWDADPQKRPTANELEKILEEWYFDINDENNNEFYQQYEKIKEIEVKEFNNFKSWLETNKSEKQNFESWKSILSEMNQKNIHNWRREFRYIIKEYENSDCYWEKIKQWKNEVNKKSLLKTFYQTHPQAIYTSRLLNYKNLPEPQNSKEINEVFYKLVDDLEDLRISNIVEFGKELEKRSNSLDESWEILKEESIDSNSSSTYVLVEREETPPIEIKEEQIIQIEIPPK